MEPITQTRNDNTKRDVNCTLIQTANGITVTLYYDSLSPRPVDFIYRIQGQKVSIRNVG